MFGPDTVVTAIDGTDEDSTPDVSFTMYIIDKFIQGPSDLPVWAPPTGWYQSTHDLEKDLFWVDVIAGLATWTLALSPLFAVGAVAASYQAYEANTAEVKPPEGVGVRVAKAILPTSLPVEGGDKIQIVYRSRGYHHDVNGIGTAVDDAGMYFGGFFEPLLPQPREPACIITGPDEVRLRRVGPNAYATFTAVPYDLRMPSYSWTVNGHPHGTGPQITLEFGAETGPFGTIGVHVEAIDEDGLTASASTVLTVTRTQSPVGTGSESGPHSV
jgi:hypothetical protein